MCPKAALRAQLSNTARPAGHAHAATPAFLNCFVSKSMGLEDTRVTLLDRGLTLANFVRPFIDIPRIIDSKALHGAGSLVRRRRPCDVAPAQGYFELAPARGSPNC